MNNFYQGLSKSSMTLLEKQKQNIISFETKNQKDNDNKKDQKTEEETKTSELPQLLNEMSLINNDIKEKYENLIFKYNEIIFQPFSRFTSCSEQFYSNYHTEFGNISNNLIGLKKKTDKALYNYKVSSKSLKKINKEGQEIDPNLKQRLIIENKNNEEKYKLELNQENKLIEMFNDKYNDINHKFIEYEESFLAFIKDAINKTTLYIKEKIAILNELLEKLIKLNGLIDVKKEAEEVKQKFNKFKRFGDRFQKEEFISSFGNSQKSVNLNLDFLNKLKERSVENTSNEKTTKNKKQNELDSFINDFIEKLFGSEEIDIDSISKIMDYIYKERSFSKQFFDNFISSRKSTFYILQNINNLQNLSNIINTINTSKSKEKEYLYDINSAVIYIAERTYCIHNNEKIYLCAILSHNKLYKTKQFWIDLIEFKLARKLEEHLKHLQSIEIKNDKNNNKFFSMKNALKFFNKDKNNTFLIQSSGLAKNIKGYKSLADNKKPYLDQFATNEIEIILKEYISHICNFNFSNENAIDIVINISNKFQFTKEVIQYFVNDIGTWLYSVKRKLPEDSHDASTKHKIYEIKNTLNIWKQSFEEESSVVLSEKQKLISIIETSKFLPLDNIPNIVCLSKVMSKKGRTKIFRDFLQRKDLSVKDRLKIWKCLLKVSDIIKKYDYKKLIEEKEYKTKLSEQIMNQIVMDVKRTSFKKEYEENYKKSLTNVLNVIAFLKPELNYCQGMSYIGSFLIQLTQNEEETFYLMFGIVENTEFATIFISDLQKLKLFFYSLDRLICIFVPDAYSLLKINNIKVNYFCTSWFLTMFSNSSLIVEPEKPPKIIFKIWDEFFLKGWKSFLSTGLILMKTNEEKISKLKHEQILQFLVVDILKSEFFDEKYFETFLEMSKKFYIKNKLLRNLEAQYIFEKNKKKNKEE